MVGLGTSGSYVWLKTFAKSSLLGDEKLVPSDDRTRYNTIPPGADGVSLKLGLEVVPAVAHGSPETFRSTR
jgi:hypothetical protein